MMNIVFTVDSMESGGAERVVSILANEMAKIGHKITIVIVSSTICQSFYHLDDAINLVCLQNDKKVGIISRVKRLRAFFKNNKPNAIISFLPHVNVYTYFASIGLHIPLFASERNDPQRDPRGFLLRTLKKLVFRKACGCVFQTKQAADYYKGIDASRKIVIFNPVNCSLLPLSIDREKTVLSVGRLVEQKNHIFTIDVFKRFLESHPDYKMIIVGDGEEKEKIYRHIEILGLSEKVNLVGIDSDWTKNYSKSKMFVLSSLREGMPNALIEALSIGIPCISSNCPIGGPAELIKNEYNGFLFDVNDGEQLLKCMIKIADDDYLTRLFFDNSRSIIGEMEPSIICDKWMNFIYERIKEKQK